ncbi:MAG TPA: 3-deoxy-8-phosphooctulonate synthase [Candidatus Syntrophosphaera sp.]|mgnify:CR=1 FL=1|jgi:2-dehydro-3-deoxyphosphooctonate aldolase (KDO 8-P synthase)|nr:3-deoxy-8-phosphooctulonate synthase [Candidatus Syntrophosphaera sp.]
MQLYEQLKASPRFFLIAGPCVVDEASVMREIAAELVRIQHDLGLPVVFKASYKKANRSSIDSYSGPGQEAGLTALAEIKKEFGLPLLTDVHERAEVPAAAEVCDILQIPAFLCRQTELIAAAAETGKIVNIKKGQFLAPEDMFQAALKAGANQRVLLTERGSSFGYHNLVVDFRSFAVMAGFGYPVVYDVTHSLQLPGSGTTSGGTPQYAAMLARAAIATGKVRGIFLETHPQPSQAKSDAASMLPLKELRSLLEGCIKVFESLTEE